MDWQEPFKKAVSYFKQSKYGECLRLLNYALENGGQNQYAIYDSRAAVYEKNLRFREALLDRVCSSQSVKFDEASKMVDLALQKLSPSDPKNHPVLIALQSQIVESRKRSTCHIGVLPAELLSIVFGYMVQDDAVHVILVTRVCPQWRAVALGDASLWSTLVLSNRNPSRKSTLWIQRSQGRIRNLILRRALLDRADWGLEKLNGIQWAYLRSCCLEDVEILEQLEKVDASCVISQLETLEIRDKLVDSREKFASHLGNNLKHLTLDVTRLGRRRFMEDLFLLLAQNPSLQYFAFDASYDSFNTRPAETFQLSHLTVLEFSRDRPSCSGSFDFRHWKHFLKTQGLKSLTFDSCAHLSSSELLRILSSNPCLESLTLNRESGIAAPVLDSLAHPTLCPNLSQLDLSSCVDVTSQLLVRVVKSRLGSSQIPAGGAEEKQPVVEEICSLTVNECPGVATDALPWLRENVARFSCVYYMSKRAGSTRRR
ncbi:hypothetical protein BDP27DRAFT_1436223 [Rhodocollybia butyracea]|uniref:F-box domain-containing protein n=1 Tax=Rhodocollybia butyracea TaxID=206335 RepID=A0A9P5P775_9AGAR|nr:hypothetical protein BDP27DRAFT_1436223 [Rhodocollybia butyracea]